VSRQTRPYQQKAIDASLKRLSEGVTKQIISIPTGGGKTYVCVKLSEQGNFKRVLFCVDAEELAEQAALAFLREKFDDSLIKHIEDVGFINYIRNGGLLAGNEYKVGLIKADVFQPHGNVVVASLQTLHNRLNRLNPDDFDLMIIDECHGATANTVVKSINFFKPKLLLGVSATPRREDNMQLGNVFDEIVYDYGIKQAVDEKYLCEINAIRVSTNISLDKVKTIGGDLNEKQLSQEVDTLVRNNMVADAYLKYAKGRQTIGYSVDIKHAIHLAECFVEKGIKATAISSKEELTGNRTQKVKDFKLGKYEVVFNCGVLVKGFDFPNVGAIIHACPTKSLTKWLQATGRCLRLKDEEYVKKFGQNAILIDIVDSTTRHNLVNAWELDREKKAEDKVFITSENREKLFEAQRKRAKLEHTRMEDEFVNLLRLPKPKISSSIRMKEAATDAQINWIKSLGYDTDNQSYSKEMCSQIIMDLPCTEKQLSYLKFLKYDVNSVAVVTRGMAEAAISEHKKKEEKATREKQQNNIKNNLPFKF